MFHRGQRVVCVDASPRPESNNEPSLLVKDREYTIRTAYISLLTGSQGVTLEEVAPHPHRSGWYADRFRPVVEKKHDISVFEKMLKRKGVKEDA